MAPVRLFFRDLQDEFFGLSRGSPKEPDQPAVCTIAQDLDCIAVDAPCRLGPRTYRILEIARLAIEVQDRAGSRAVAISIDAVQRENLTLDVGLKPDRQNVRIGSRYAVRTHSPDAQGIIRPDCDCTRNTDQRCQQEHRSHAPTMCRGARQNKVAWVRRGYITLARR